MKLILVGLRIDRKYLLARLEHYLARLDPLKRAGVRDSRFLRTVVRGL